MRVSACAGAADLGRWGIEPGRCIDDRRLRRAFASDAALIDGLDAGLPPELFGPPAGNPLRDKGQRSACGCLCSKDIGCYNSCPHGCVYCYANVSAEAARRFYANHDPELPLLSGGEAK